MLDSMRPATLRASSNRRIHASSSSPSRTCSLSGRDACRLPGLARLGAFAGAPRASRAGLRRGTCGCRERSPTHGRWRRSQPWARASIPGTAYVLRADPVTFVAGRDDVLLERPRRRPRRRATPRPRRPRSTALRRRRPRSSMPRAPTPGSSTARRRPRHRHHTAGTACAARSQPHPSAASDGDDVGGGGCPKCRCCCTTHPVNDAREAAGLPPVTGLWICGRRRARRAGRASAGVPAGGPRRGRKATSRAGSRDLAGGDARDPAARRSRRCRAAPEALVVLPAGDAPRPTRPRSTRDVARARRRCADARRSSRNSWSPRMQAACFVWQSRAPGVAARLRQRRSPPARSRCRATEGTRDHRIVRRQPHPAAAVLAAAGLRAGARARLCRARHCAPSANSTTRSPRCRPSRRCAASTPPPRAWPRRSRAASASSIVADYDADGATACAVGVRGLRALGARRRLHRAQPLRVRLRPDAGDRRACRRARAAPASSPSTTASPASTASPLRRARHRGAGHRPSPARRRPARAGDHRQPEPARLRVPEQAHRRCRRDVLRAARHARGACAPTARFAAQPEPNLARLLDLVALGTVADVVRLDQVNRVLRGAGSGAHARRARRNRVCARCSRWPGATSRARHARSIWVSSPARGSMPRGGSPT